MSKKWLHRGCMREGDEMVQPKQTKNGNCERCQGEGALFLVEVAESTLELIDKALRTLPEKMVQEINERDAVRKQEEEVKEEAASEIASDSIGIAVQVEDEKGTILDGFKAHMPIKYYTASGCVSVDTNETVSQLEQLKARVEKLEQYLKENQT